MKDVNVNTTARCVLSAVSRFARGLPQFTAIANGLTWAPLANSVSVRQVSPAAAAGKQQAGQAAATAVSATISPSKAAAAYQPRDALPAADTQISPGAVGAKRRAEAEATHSGEKRLKAAIAIAQERSRATLIGYAFRDLQGRDYVIVELKQPAYLTLSHTEPVPDLVKVYNSRRSPGKQLS